MAVYSLGARTINATTATAAAEVFTLATDRPRVLAVELEVAVATTSTYGIGRPAAIGLLPTSPVRPLAEDPIEPLAQLQMALAWGTGPTAPANFFRRFAVTSGSAQGRGIIWSFPRGLTIPVSSSLVLWNIGGANGVADFTVVVDE